MAMSGAATNAAAIASLLISPRGSFLELWRACWHGQPFKLLSREADCVISATTFGVESARGRPTLRILLAEDNRTLADWLGKALRHAGYSVDCMRDGVDADHVLLTQAYDLVILDIGLPRMDGREVLHRLRRRGASVPVLVL